MMEIRRRLDRQRVAVAGSTDDLTVDMLRLAASGVTLAVAVFLTLVR